MKFLEFVTPERILVGMKANSKAEAFAELADILARDGVIQDQESFQEHFLNREKLGSTGISRGVATPHARLREIDHICLAIGISRKGIEWGAMDGRPVHLIFLIASSPNYPVDHLRILEFISKTIRDETFVRFLKQARSVDEVLQLLEEMDNDQFGR